MTGCEFDGFDGTSDISNKQPNRKDEMMMIIAGHEHPATLLTIEDITGIFSNNRNTIMYSSFLYNTATNAFNAYTEMIIRLPRFMFYLTWHQ